MRTGIACTAATVVVLGCMLLTRESRGEDGPTGPPIKVYPGASLIVADADDALLDADGKLWAWRIKADEQKHWGHGHRWLKPDRREMEKAWHSEKPTLVRGAELRLVDENRTVWRVDNGRQLWIYDGKTWAARGSPGSRLRFDGGAAALGEGRMVFGWHLGLDIYDGKTWHRERLLPKEFFGRGRPVPLMFCRDQAGRLYTYNPEAGCIWAVEKALDPGARARAPTWRLREIRVTDSVRAPVGEVARDAEGTVDEPRLVAGGVLLTAKMLRGLPPDPHDIAGSIEKDLRSPDYYVRCGALSRLKADGKDGVWRYSHVLLADDVGRLAGGVRNAYREALRDRIKRFEPGMCDRYAQQCVALGMIKEEEKAKATYYRGLLISLEFGHIISREERFSLQAAYDERLKQRERKGLPFSVSGRWENPYFCAAFFEEVDGNSWMEAYCHGWEEPDRGVLWMAMGKGLWRVTKKPGDEHEVGFQKTHTSWPSFGAWRVLGRDDKGRLLVAGCMGGAKLDVDRMAWCQVEPRYGIWALTEPKGQGATAPDQAPAP